MEVRIGVVYTPKELDVEHADDDSTDGKKAVDRGRDRREKVRAVAHRLARAARSASRPSKLAYVEIGRDATPIARSASER